MVVIGERIKELRKKSRYTQTDLANLLGITKTTVAAYENDSRLPSYDVLIRMASVFKISIDSLLLNRSDAIIEVSGLTVEQVEMIEKLVVTLREYNLMQQYIKACANDRENYGKRVIQFNDFINNPNIFNESNNKF